jgi:CMP-N-acetylneuraminic acid synthetase/cyclopropane fatty-acyl-phospholipid synthase-like methyltransferase
MNTASQAKHVALIPAKEHSSRCENKNWKPFIRGQNLVEYLVSILPVGVFDKIIVSTDRQDVKFQQGVEIHRREKRLSTKQSPVNDLIQVIIDKYNLSDEDYVWLLNPTSPLRDKTDFLELQRLLNSNRYDSLISVSEIKPFVWQDSRPLFDTNYPRKNTQDFGTKYGVENGQFIVFKVSLFKATQSWYSDKTYLYSQDLLTKSVDIDTEQDFALASLLAQHETTRPVETIKNETLQIDLIVNYPYKEHTGLLYNHFSRYDRAIESLKINSNDIVIDASCGLGYGSYILSLKAKHVYGLDVNVENLEKANTLFSNSNLQFLTYKDFRQSLKRICCNNADKIVCIETFEHMIESEANTFIKKLLYYLRFGGDMFLTVPIGNNEPSTYNEHHLFEPSIDYMYNLFNNIFKKIKFEISTFRNSFSYDTKYCMITLNCLEEKNDEISKRSE